MNALRPVRGDSSFRYARLIGTGGIGSGMLFKLAGDHTLGRDESRLGELTDAQDYCKLHIICHYPAVLLGAGTEDGGGFELIPVGKVGVDAEGESLIRRMSAAGMDVSRVERVPDARTLFSVCFQYPDFAGGNMTSSNGASGRVGPADIDRAFAALPPLGEAGEIALAAPEVPLEARLRLLELGRARGSFTAASVLASEVAEYARLGGWALTDLLAVNAEEARVMAGPAAGHAGGANGHGEAGARSTSESEGNADTSSAGARRTSESEGNADTSSAGARRTSEAEGNADTGGAGAAEGNAGTGGTTTAECGSRDIAARCAAILTQSNPRAKLVMTDGAAGCFSCEGGEVYHTPPLRVAAVSTAGAGDAMLGGILCGLCCGLPFAKRRNDPHFGATPLESAVELGTLLAAFSVTSPHSIHPDANARTIAGFAKEHGIALGDDFASMLSAYRS